MTIGVGVDDSPRFADVGPDRNDSRTVFFAGPVCRVGKRGFFGDGPDPVTVSTVGVTALSSVTSSLDRDLIIGDGDR